MQFNGKDAKWKCAFSDRQCTKLRYSSSQKSVSTVFASSRKQMGDIFLNHVSMGTVLCSSRHQLCLVPLSILSNLYQDGTYNTTDGCRYQFS
ncbi:hypothetical protein KIN20_035029 [Parelaphostrongylus tenuis]|uniref:Uncharacterized protein n=1 Tax=Parelaphostrongylus tenuis TaxID=148309 RepID=A0AAD5M8I9_PARTN|nr:hypothetical protein KIN20_010866 [Parelaphostrongylus tenuis]KAJ1354060.1 hypothetical protein KIN20_010870 [Parelaphostrongylus tenuis]KAJ1372779.1 hypothetical protein KIN20_035029 [Parelaphostrongylus tenuis]